MSLGSLQKILVEKTKQINNCAEFLEPDSITNSSYVLYQVYNSNILQFSPFAAYTVKSHVSALGSYNIKRVFGQVLNGGIGGGKNYKRNKRNVSERRDKTYLRNELKLTTITFGVTFVRHLLCVTINGVFLSQTSIKHLCDCNNSNETLKQLQALTLSTFLFALKQSSRYHEHLFLSLVSLKLLF